ncbi:uncharacterized protein LOC123530485 [Mercenaria mercenaria]|uniref:uncharacterized protein LOC123530485 n=1 Tax=Mercenaria mercenaria TaxID=6596 RepID=UPI00234F1E3C|nr:uncharacterized protein LOC123530485 [Mercenaria mercenaria]
MSILYISKIGPGTKSFLLKEYGRTDKAFADMWDWPAEFASHPKKYFQTKKKLMNHINTQRNKLDRESSDVYGEITFYSEIVEFIMQWMIERIRDSGFGNTWKSLVVFQKVTRCMLDTGAERAYGTMFFTRGNFPNIDLYDNYFKRIFRFNYNYRSSTFYSDLVDPLFDTASDQSDTTIAIRTLRNEIKSSNFSGLYTSKEKAEAYFDNITLRVDFLFRLQKLISSRIIDRINITAKEYVQNTVIFSIIASVVICSCPLIMYFTESLTSTMQNYSRVLMKASDDLNKEKSKTDSLLYQILPKPVAERLKRKRKIDSEFFKSATIMFTSVVDFTQLSIEYSALELADLLNNLYTYIDEKIERYDVYKVETINDTYMVVSGVPVRNGDRHASEIAYLALDIVSMATGHTFMSKGIRSPVHLLLGISTANRIHISETTYRNLKKTDSFKITTRGSIVIKGKGEMNTYWLTDSSRKYYRADGTSTWQLPGQTETDSSVSIPTGQGTSQGINLPDMDMKKEIDG